MVTNIWSNCVCHNGRFLALETNAPPWPLGNLPTQKYMRKPQAARKNKLLSSPEVIKHY